MLLLFRMLSYAVELALALPVQISRFALNVLLFNPRLGKLRYVLAAAVAYVIFAVLLVYVFAPIRGIAGQVWMAPKLHYDSERWLATAIYDKEGEFVGTFDASLDSQRDFNTTDSVIELDSGYAAHPDHKSIPVQTVPDGYWRCLVYHEDRNIGTWINPFGIDLIGVLKIPLSSIEHSIAAGGLRIGVGGSTLPMQLSRVIYKTPPRSTESAFQKLGRKFGEWWDAPVIYWTLTKGGSPKLLKEWTANHLWLAQRTGGQSLHGVEVASRIVFGKAAKDLTLAEQFVLASAVNRPIILLEGSEKLNAVRLDRWRHIVDVRARKCASALIAGEAEQKAVWFELTQIAGGPPDPQVRPTLQKALEEIDPVRAKTAEANPAYRANMLIPDARYGAREEMKHEFGFAWRDYVRGVTLTLDVVENRRFRSKIQERLAAIQKQYAAQIDPAFTLDRAELKDAPDKKLPSIVVVAANRKGEIVRYFEAGDDADYFGSPVARDRQTGQYEPERETRAIASIGKIVAAIAIANEGRDTPETLYVDTNAPAKGLDSCLKGDGTLRQRRKARIAFACSLSTPIEWRAAQLGQARIARLIGKLGLTMPPRDASGEGTPPSTAVVRGLVTASPRRVHQMAAVVLAALTGQGRTPVPLPTLIKHYDRAIELPAGADVAGTESAIVPNEIIKVSSHELLRTFLSAPLCTVVGKERIGTMKSISDWCADRKPGVRLHFGKTGTMVTLDQDATVDAWAAGGFQFASGAAFSYVVVIGTGNTREPWARKLHAAQVATPLVEELLKELASEAKIEPVVAAAQATKKATKSKSVQ